MINAHTEQPQDLQLVLDDFHVIDSIVILQAMSFFLDTSNPLCVLLAIDGAGVGHADKMTITGAST